MQSSAVPPPPRAARAFMAGDQVEISPNAAWEVHPRDVKQRLNDKADMLLLDVRLLREWQVARIEGATLIPLNELPARAAVDLAAWKKKPIVIFCHAGVRSLNAAAFLRHLGFEDVKSMAGGIDLWTLMIDPDVPRY